MKKLVLIAVVFSCVSSTAWAGVSGLHNTGEFGIGVPDPYYTLTAVPSGSSTAVGAAPNPSWISAGEGAAWIGPTSGLTTDPVGWYTYELTFTITDVDPVDVVLTGNWSVDNSGKILLNGIDTGIAKGDEFTDTQEYRTIENFSITSGFETGVNTLEFQVYNIQGSGLNPTGLLVTDLSATVMSIPAPGAILLGMMGTGLVGWMRRHRAL